MLEPLNDATLLHEMTAEWGSMRLLRRFYLTSAAPPLDLTTSVRAIVFRANEVLVIDGVNGDRHVWPGGRREGEENLEQTLRREVLEESGWSIADLHPFGIVHFKHLTARPSGYAYPYPDFLQAIFIAEGVEFDAAAIVRGDWESASQFLDLDTAMSVIDPDQREILRAALDERLR